MPRITSRIIAWLLIIGIAVGSPVVFASEPRARVTGGVVEKVLEPRDAEGKTIGRLVVRPHLSRDAGSALTVEKDGRVVGTGEVRFSPLTSSIEVTIASAGTNERVRFTIGQNGSAIETSIEFDGLEAGISADRPALRAFVQESRQIAADVLAGTRQTRTSEELARVREVLQIRGDFKQIRTRLAQSAVQIVIDEIASILVESNGSERTPELFALQNAAGFLAPKIFLDHIKASAPARLSMLPAAPQQHFRQRTTDNRQLQTQECDWGAIGTCDTIWILEMGMCYDITWHCINECWFVFGCDVYSSLYWDNFHSCMWLGDSCALFYTGLFYWCLSDACQGCPDCCQVNC